MNKLIIAAAGSGKTTHLVKQAFSNSSNNVLITTFTDANEQGIRDKFYELYGYIPSHVTIMPWFSFLLRHGIKPYQSYLTNKNLCGVHMLNASLPELRFIKDDNEKYYITNNGKVYLDKIAKMVCKICELSNRCNLERIKKIFPYIFIDEVQDYAGYDLEIMRLLSNYGCNMLLVGDVRQTTYRTYYEKKYSKYSGGKIIDFVKDNIKILTVDTKTLNTTHRNNSKICALANDLYPQLSPCDSDMDEVTDHDGIFYVHESDVDAYLKQYEAVQLRYDARTSVNENYKSYSFGNSKGLGFDRVLIYPTKEIMNWLEGKNSSLKSKTISKFYVAITRARYSVAFVYKTKKKPQNIRGITYWSS